MGGSRNDPFKADDKHASFLHQPYFSPLLVCTTPCSWHTLSNSHLHSLVQKNFPSRQLLCKTQRYGPGCCQHHFKQLNWFQHQNVNLVIFKYAAAYSSRLHIALCLLQKPFFTTQLDHLGNIERNCFRVEFAERHRKKAKARHRISAGEHVTPLVSLGLRLALCTYSLHAKLHFTKQTAE